ncbi:hypothetical protein HanPSC8_Chr17g0774411 [Helianthus annuus]|nr:hypothetical protein HanPSC8_Chr17g0774411 [Helianthus annuus]
MASDLYAMAPSLTLDLNNDGTTCNSGTIITPSHLPPRFRSVCYGSIANPTHLSHSRSELELIDTKPNWVKGDTWVIMVVKLKLGVMWLLEGEGERDMKPVVEVEVVLETERFIERKGGLWKKFMEEEEEDSDYAKTEEKDFVEETGDNEMEEMR